MKNADKKAARQAATVSARARALGTPGGVQALAKLSWDDGLPVAWIEGEWRRRAVLS